MFSRGWGHHDRQAGLTGREVRHVRVGPLPWGHILGTRQEGLAPSHGLPAGTRASEAGPWVGPRGPVSPGRLTSAFPQSLTLPLSWQHLHSWSRRGMDRGEEGGVGASGTVSLGSRPPAGTVAAGNAASPVLGSVLGSLGGWTSGQWGFG